MSKLDELYKESGITRNMQDEPDTPQQNEPAGKSPRKSVIVNAFFYVVIFGAAFYWFADSGLFITKQVLYFAGIFMSFVLIFIIRRMVKAGKRK